jgi:hypothetical protein
MSHDLWLEPVDATEETSVHQKMWRCSLGTCNECQGVFYGYVIPTFAEMPSRQYYSVMHCFYKSYKCADRCLIMTSRTICAKIIWWNLMWCDHILESWYVGLCTSLTTAGPSETLVPFYQTIWHHISKHCNLHIHHHDNLHSSLIFQFIWRFSWISRFFNDCSQYFCVNKCWIFVLAAIQVTEMQWWHSSLFGSS